MVGGGAGRPGTPGPPCPLRGQREHGQVRAPDLCVLVGGGSSPWEGSDLTGSVCGDMATPTEVGVGEEAWRSARDTGDMGDIPQAFRRREKANVRKFLSVGFRPRLVTRALISRSFHVA